MTYKFILEVTKSMSEEEGALIKAKNEEIRVVGLYYDDLLYR